MSNKYLVNWSDIGIEGAETFGAKSAHAAYLDFIDENVNRSVPVSVWSGNGVGVPQEFEEHFDGKKMTEIAREKWADLLKHFQAGGFSALSKEEVSLIEPILEQSMLNPESVSEEEFNFSKVLLSDEAAYRFFSLRLNTLSTLQQQAMLKEMNINLSSISSKTSGVRMASMFTGMVASRHLSEELYGQDEGSQEFDGGDF